MSLEKKKPTHSKSADNKVADQKLTHDKRLAKRAVVLGTDKKSRLPFFAILTCIVLVVAGSIFFFVSRNSKYAPEMTQISPGSSESPDSGESPGSNESPESRESPVGSESQFAFPEGIFDDSKARHYEYKAEGVTIKYFILKSSDGVIRAAFDACDVCWRAGRGYFQSGDFMICRNCRRSFASNFINVIQGGCNPVPLNRNIEEGNVEIHVKDILEGRKYFNFSGRT